MKAVSITTPLRSTLFGGKRFPFHGTIEDATVSTADWKRDRKYGRLENAAASTAD